MEVGENGPKTHPFIATATAGLKLHVAGLPAKPLSL